MKKYFHFVLALSIIFSACKRHKDEPHWKADVLAPLVKTTLSIKDILADSVYKEGTDSSVSIIYSQTLPSYKLDIIKPFSVAEFKKTVKLSSLELSVPSISDTSKLGKLFPLSKAFQGKPFPIPKNFSFPGPDLPFNLSDIFKSAEFLSGTMEITVTSSLPATIKEINFKLVNKGSNLPVIDTSITNIIKDVPKVTIIDLANKVITGEFNINITKIELAEGIVIIDTNASVVTKVEFKNLQVRNATAIFPTQDVVNEKVYIPALSGKVQAKEVILKSGKVTIDVHSTAQDTLYFTYKLPGATKNGIPFGTNEKVPPSTKGVQYNYDFSGYTLDMSGKPGKDTVNSIFSDLAGRIQYTGKEVYLTLDDYIDITITISGIIPSYIRGYLGDTTISVSGNIPLDIFKRVNGGTLDFEKVNVSLAIENGIGDAGTVKVHSIKTTNAKGSNAILNDATIIEKDIPIAKAVDKGSNSGFNPATTIIKTSSAASLINILPNALSYNIDFSTGSKTVIDYNNFIYSDSYLTPSFDIEIPLTFSAKGLELSDTVDFLSKPLETSINNGAITVIAKNQFPLDAKLTMYLLNDLNYITDSLTSAEKIVAATINPLTKKVTQKTETKIPFYFDSNKFKNVLSAKRIIFKVRFDTAPANQKVAIYSNYELNFIVVGDVNYSVK